MAQLASESVVDAVVTRLRQIAAIGATWGTSFEAIKIIEEGDLAYLPERPDMVADLPAVFCSIDGPVEIEIVGLGAPEFQQTFNVRCVYIDNYSRVTDKPWTMKRNRVDVLADAFLDSAVLNGISTTLNTLLSAVCTSVDFQPAEETLLNAMGLEDVYAGAFTVQIVGLSVA